MDIYAKLRTQLQNLCQKWDAIEYFIAEVVSVESDTTCTVKLEEDLNVSDVRLRTVVNDEDSGILITPKVGSYVLVADLSGGKKVTMVTVMYSEIDKIVINGGKNDGLINICELTDKLNNLVDEVNSLKDKFNGHTHSCNLTVTVPFSPSPLSGMAAGTSEAPGSMASAATKFNKDDYEDTLITH